MKKQIKLLTCLTKPLVLFLLLFALGVGQMWGTARTFKSGQEIFFKDASGNITWGDLKCLWKVSSGDIFAYFWNDSEEAWSSSASLASGEINKENAIYKITVPGSGKEFTKVVFTRHPNGVTPTWNNRWNQTTDQYPEESYNMFCISNDGDYDGSRNPTHKWKGTWDRYSTGALCGDFNNWDPDRGKFTSGRVILELEASKAYGFKVLKGDGTVLDNWYGLNSGNITNTTSSWWQLKSKENNCTVTTGEAGEYCFHWDGSSYLGIYYPQARFSASQYIYFNVEGETGWKDLGDKVMFWTKYYDSGGNNPDGGLSCNTPVETYVYYAQIPNHDYIGQVQLNRYDGNTWKASSAVAYAYNRTSSSQNCMIEESGKESASGDGDWTPQWTTYCPPTTSETFADNSTTKISWQPNTNDGSTSGKAIWVKTGTTLKVTANASKAVADPNMTIKYDFDVNSGSTTTQTTGAYTATASTNNTQYAVNAKMYTNYNLDNTKNSTKHTHTIYYKALNTYSVTHTLSGVTKASGESGTDAAAYYVAYDATYTADAGYYLPSDITVTIGGVTKTKGTDYTWTVTDGTSGALSILTDKIDGNVVVTINGVYRWSVAGSWKVITPGEGDPYWDADTYAMGTITQVSSDYVCSVTVTLDANTNYTFKIVDRAASPYEYWGNNTITYYINYSTDMSSGWTFGNNSSNTAACGLTAAGAGTYTFTWNITQSKLKVTFPTSYYVTAAGNPAAGGTVTPSSATYMSTSVGGEITATPNYSHYFNGWTSNAGGTFTDNTAATTTFKPASADATVTAAFPERTAFIEGNFQVYNSTRATRTKTGDSWVDDATTIKMTYDSENNRYYLHTYSTPAELAEQLNSTNAYFYVKTSTSGSSIANDASYHAYASGDAAQALSAYGSSNKKATGSSVNNFHFTGSEDGYVILYFNGTHVWYELECALSYYGGEGATGDAPASRTYYAYGSNQTAASNTYSKTGYTFDHWDTAADDSGSDYAAGATNVAMNAHEVCLHAQWTAKDYTINLANMEATTPGTTSVDVTFDASTNMTASDPIDKPTKTHYDFGGYWTSENTGETLDHQLIGADGKWIKDVEGYTSHDGSGNPTWVHDYPISLYAKWTEHEYAVTLAISPAGAGSVSCGSSTTAKYVTASGDITATPSPGYSFREWGFSKVGEDDYDVYVSDESTYSSTKDTIRIKAQRDGTLTANFTANGYTVTLEDRGADEGHKGTPNVSVTYDATTNLTSAISKPEKTYYTFDGYWTSNDEGETPITQLIDANGNWKKSISGYTGASGENPTWKYAGNITLYAKWIETKHNVQVAVSPSTPFKTGSVTIGGSEVTEVSVGKIIPTAAMTAVAANNAFLFKEWQLTEHVSRDEAKYSANDNPNSFFAEDDDQTITAVFQTRFGVIGSLKSSDAAGHGMPGWVWSNAVGFDVNGFTDFGEGEGKGVDFRYSTTLDPNTQYKFRLYDRIKDKAIGCAAEDVLPAEDGGGKYHNWQLNHTDDGQDILINTTGRGTYTFHITNISADGNFWPSIQVDRPTSYQLNLGWGYVETVDLTTVKSGNVGGTVTAVATEGGEENPITNGGWVVAGGTITFTPHPADDYVFAGWFTSSDYSSEFGDKLNPLPISSISGTVNVYAKFVEKSTTFEGDVVGHETEWNNTGNWSGGALPTINDIAIITKPVTVDIAHATAKSIVLDQNSHTGKLTIQANKGLEVAGTITRTTDGSNRLATRPEDLILESSSAGNASLIFDNSNSCQATVQMYSIGNIEGNTWNWQFMGTPFTSANALYSYYGSYLYEWKAGGYWDAVANGGTMTPFTGYCITQDDPNYYVMDGTLNPNSDVNISIPASKEFVMANSWTAPISVCNFTTTTLPLDNKTIYLFNTGYKPDPEDPAGEGTGPGTYIAMPINSAIYTGNYLIAPMEGFYVDNTSGSAATITLKYDELVRPQVSRDIVAGAMHAPKRVTAETKPDVMKIKATGSRYADRVVILAREDFSTAFDNGWDGKNINEPGVAPIIYALRADGTKDAVSAIPTFEGTVVGFRQGEDNQYTFSFNYDGEDIWYLNDLKEEKSTLIDAANTYSFVAEAGDAEARFIISATPIQKLPTGIGNDANDGMVKVRKLIINDQLFIIRAGRMYNAVGSIVK